MGVTRARVVVTHWVHPEVGEFLTEFCDALKPSREEGLWPRHKVAELAADADGLMVCMADSVDEAFLARRWPCLTSAWTRSLKSATSWWRHCR